MFDSHCHIHADLFKLDSGQALKRSVESGVKQLVVVGTDGPDSRKAVAFAQKHSSRVWSAIGLHPHEAKDMDEHHPVLAELAEADSVVAVGECGLDYWYGYSTPAQQEASLRFQIELALQHNLALIFHVRGTKEDPDGVFEDFFRIIDDYAITRGVVHSFTAGQASLKGVLSRSLMVGVNGIATFTGDQEQLDVFASIPLQNMVLETDAPFLTPKPKRGKVNSPEYMGYTAQFLAELRSQEYEELVAATTNNAQALFGIN